MLFKLKSYLIQSNEIYVTAKMTQIAKKSLGYKHIFVLIAKDILSPLVRIISLQI